MQNYISLAGQLVGSQFWLFSLISIRLLWLEQAFPIEVLSNLHICAFWNFREYCLHLFSEFRQLQNRSWEKRDLWEQKKIICTSNNQFLLKVFIFSIKRDSSVFANVWNPFGSEIFWVNNCVVTFQNGLHCSRNSSRNL